MKKLRKHYYRESVNSIKDPEKIFNFVTDFPLDAVNPERQLSSVFSVPAGDDYTHMEFSDFSEGQYAKVVISDPYLQALADDLDEEYLDEDDLVPVCTIDDKSVDLLYFNGEDIYIFQNNEDTVVYEIASQGRPVVAVYACKTRAIR